jgi:ketosteroid isomerase-like protein
MVSPGVRLVMFAFLALASGLAALPASAFATSERAPAETVTALCAALDAGDVDQASRLFADDAVVIQPRVGGLPQVAVGSAQINWWLSNLVQQHVRWGEDSIPDVVGNRAYWTHDFGVDAFRQLGTALVEVDSQIVLTDDGRIESLRTSLTPTGARALQSATLQLSQ